MTNPIYYMRDNHTFRPLTPDTERAITEIGEELAKGFTCGLLCTQRPGAAGSLNFDDRDQEGSLEKARAWLDTEIAARTESQITSGKAESIDTPEFRELLKKYHHSTTWDTKLIAHIEAVREKDREEAAEPYSDLLRELCFQLSVGGYNSEGLMPVETARAKINSGIDMLVQPWRDRAIEAEAERDHWKANHANVVARLKLATQRPDLPVDRIPAIRELGAMQERAEKAEAELKAIAERQAADLSSLQRYDASVVDHEYGVVGFLPKAVGRAVMLADVEKLLSPAQQEPAVTPEGVQDLPTLPKNFGLFNIDGPDGHRIKGYTAEQMRDYAHAALAATKQAAEPVYQVLGNGGDWEDVSKEGYDAGQQGECKTLYEWRILYRAAPLQQGEKPDADAGRIKACLTACEGLTTEQVQQVKVLDLLVQHHQVQRERAAHNNPTKGT